MGYRSGAHHSLSRRKASDIQPFGMSTEDAHPRNENAPLPPLPLRNAYGRYRWWAALVCTALWVSLGLAGWGAVTAFKNHRMPRSPDKFDFCEAGRSKGTERWFLVDTHVARHLTFGQAKAIDLVWHGVAGQIGRLFHGWIFYYVMSRNITWIAERFAIPYDVLIDLSFSPTHPGTLISIGRMILRRTHKRLTRKMVWIMGMILYILVFPTVWGGATGYISSSIAAYHLPGLDGVGNYVTARTDLLNLCWVADMEPIGGDANTVVPGPLLSELQNPTTRDNSFRSMMSEFPNYSHDNHETVHVSDEFKNLYTYSMTETTIKRYFKPRSPDSYLLAQTYYGGPKSNSNQNVGYKESDGPYYRDHDGTPLLLERTVPGPCRAFASRTGMGFNEDINNCAHVYPPYFVDTLVGWLFASEGQARSGRFTPSEYVPAQYSNRRLSWNTSSMVFNSDVSLVEAEFVLDPSVTKGLPYNSTLWWENRNVDIPGPFLKLGVFKGQKCSWFDEDSLPICICRNNTPVTDNFLLRDDDNLCLSQDDYVWGFVSYILLVGVILEVAWLGSCLILWYVSGTSRLVTCDRDGSGNIRRILDIAPIILHELGNSTGAHPETELRRQLQNRDPVGYVVEEKGEESRIQMRAFRNGLKEKRTLELSPDKVYS